MMFLAAAFISVAVTASKTPGSEKRLSVQWQKKPDHRTSTPWEDIPQSAQIEDAQQAGKPYFDFGKYRMDFSAEPGFIMFECKDNAIKPGTKPFYVQRLHGGRYVDGLTCTQQWNQMRTESEMAEIRQKNPYMTDSE